MIWWPRQGQLDYSRAKLYNDLESCLMALFETEGEKAKNSGKKQSHSAGDLSQLVPTKQ